MLRIKYATMFPFCKGGKHESCMRWFLLSTGQPVPDDLLPDGARDAFAEEVRNVRPRPRARVLVVDDVPLFRKSLVTMVGTASAGSVEVVEAASGEEALAILSADPNGWQLVVTDYHMGAMNGYDLITHMRTSPALAGLPVVVFSSDSETAVKERCAALPRVRWLVKDPNQMAFDAAWRDLVRERQA
ncbi:MAG: response regulator [Actinobacteria bacterium]|nr:MAG: response regulator [Actinomycetota bacterium]